jgi:hypothetical protein
MKLTCTNWPFGLAIFFDLFNAVDYQYNIFFPGDYSGGETPDPIPNSEVKTTRADGSVTVGSCESRSLPGLDF